MQRGGVAVDAGAAVIADAVAAASNQPKTTGHGTF